jgi:DNA modification methylase
MTFTNTIIHGDCVQALAKLDPASVDFTLTDPPYLVNYRARDAASRSLAADQSTANHSERQAYRCDDRPLSVL